MIILVEIWMNSNILSMMHIEGYTGYQGFREDRNGIHIFFKYMNNKKKYLI